MFESHSLFPVQDQGAEHREWLGTTGQGSRREGWNSDEETEGERALGAADDGDGGGTSRTGAARALLR